jgi:hypothetical protein
VSTSLRSLTNHSLQLQYGVLVFLFIVYSQAPRWRLCISVHCILASSKMASLYFCSLSILVSCKMASLSVFLFIVYSQAPRWRLCISVIFYWQAPRWRLCILFIVYSQAPRWRNSVTVHCLISNHTLKDIVSVFCSLHNHRLQDGIIVFVLFCFLFHLQKSENRLLFLNLS